MNVFSPSVISWLSVAAMATLPAMAADEYAFDLCETEHLRIECIKQGITWGNSTTVRSFNADELAAIQRVATTFENTFAGGTINGTKVKVMLLMCDYVGGNAGASTSLDSVSPTSNPDRLIPTVTPQFGENILSSAEYMWKYGAGVNLHEASGSILYYDGSVFDYGLSMADIKVNLVDDPTVTGARFESLVLHELAHGFGFSAWGGNINGETPLSALGATANVTSTTNDKGVVSYFYSGEMTKLYTDGKGAQIYSTSNSTYDLSHIVNDNCVMNPTLSSDPATSFSDIELAMLTDMGWTIEDSAWTVHPSSLLTPEPTTGVLWGVGCGMVCLRRRVRRA